MIFKEKDEGGQELLMKLLIYMLLLESDRSHDEARYQLPDNYVTLKPITDADYRCLILSIRTTNNADTSHYAAVAAPFYRRRSKGAADADCCAINTSEMHDAAACRDGLTT